MKSFKFVSDRSYVGNFMFSVARLGRHWHSELSLPVFFCRFQDRQVVGANLRLASESPLLVQAQRIALGDRKPVVIANLRSASASDRYHCPVATIFRCVCLALVSHIFCLVFR
jgi:hypothetical protein